jgi:hypothetical protein
MSSPTPFDLAAMNEPGYEVWARLGTSESSRRKLLQLLVVIYHEGEKPFEIVDPKKSDEVILTAADYLEVVDYLSEKDYRPVKGRIAIEQNDDEDDE